MIFPNWVIMLINVIQSFLDSRIKSDSGLEGYKNQCDSEDDVIQIEQSVNVPDRENSKAGGPKSRPNSGQDFT